MRPGKPSRPRSMHDCTPLIPSPLLQVTSREATQTINRPKSINKVVDASPTDSSWRRRFRSWLCCLAPSHNDGYFRTDTDGGTHATGARLPQNAKSPKKYVIPPKAPALHGKKTLVLDLDETLVHSSFKPVPGADYVVPVEIDLISVDVYVQKRPWYDHFMQTIAPHFEVSTESILRQPTCLTNPN